MILLSTITTWAVAAETPSGRVPVRNRVRAASAEVAAAPQDDSAAARWDRIKSRYQAEEDSTRSAQAASVPPRRPRRAAPIRPIPNDEPAELADADESPWENEEPVAVPRPKVRPVTSRPAAPTPIEEPLPIADDEEEPAWLYGAAPLPDDSAEETEETAPVVTAQKDPEPREEPAPEPAPEGKSDLEEPFTSPADGPKPTTTTRKPRTINEISPNYDVNVDEDIRTFARQQAEQYGFSFGKGAFPHREFPGLVYQWEPSNIYHYPLYFEDPALERYGHTYGHCLQPVASIVRFGVQTVALPYQMTLDPICYRQYTLGWYRPGECAPKLCYQVPLNAHAAAVEAGVITGLFFLIP